MEEFEEIHRYAGSSKKGCLINYNSKGFILLINRLQNDFLLKYIFPFIFVLSVRKLNQIKKK